MMTHVEVRTAVAVGHNLSANLPPIDVAGRIPTLQAAMTAVGSSADDDSNDALLVTNLLNIRYLTGFTGSAGLLLVATSGPALFVSDARYDERSAEELGAANCAASREIRRTHREQQELLREFVGAHAIRRLGLEADHVSWTDMRAYESGFASPNDVTEPLDPREAVVLVPARGLVEGLRRCKDAAEIARLARASAIADAALADVLPSLATRPTESAFARALEAAMVTRGADGPSFATIIASGPNASRPHHEPGARVIEEGDEVICDFGALVDGYHSDMTRTIYVGPPSTAQRRHFDVVKAAHGAGVEAVTAGLSGVAADATCREVIVAAGWGDQFVHGVGHGSGLEIHEVPWLGETSTFTIEAGDIVTIEPGVYLAGIGGVRVEDSMVVTSEGSILLTRSPYDLVVG